MFEQAECEAEQPNEEADTLRPVTQRDPHILLSKAHSALHRVTTVHLVKQPSIVM